MRESLSGILSSTTRAFTSYSNTKSRLTTKRAFVAIVLIGALHLLAVPGSWQKPGIATETEYIARSLLEGHGFSMPSDFWAGTLFQEDGEHHATAREPVYPLLLAGAQALLGDRDRGLLAIRLLNTVAVTLTAMVLFTLAQHAFPGTSLGWIAALLWLLHPVSFMAEKDYHGTALQGLAVVTACALVVPMLRRAEARRSVLVGCALGLLSMVYAGVLLAIPMCAAVLSLRKHYKVAALLIAGAAVAVSPWAIRNWIMLDAFVPGRTMLGVTLHMTNPTLAQTYSSVETGCDRPPPWRARGPGDAVRTFRKDREKRHALMRHSSNCIRDVAPAGYAEFTEAQRDQLYLKRALAFMFENPAICVRLTVSKALNFLLGVSWSRRLITLLAMVGGFVALARLESAFLALMTAGLCLPYFLSMWNMPYYRWPIEPLFFLLATLVPLRIAHVRADAKEPAPPSEQP
jgi:hypothetical protein